MFSQGVDDQKRGAAAAREPYGRDSSGWLSLRVHGPQGELNAETDLVWNRQPGAETDLVEPNAESDLVPR